MKRLLVLVLLLTVGAVASAQLKPRPDAFPPEPEPSATKAVTMATDISQMASWDRYPTYSTYVAMMQQWATDFPALCRLDTIGTSVQSRLILSLEISGGLDDTLLPEFFYSSTIHGDEVTGYVMMLRLIDTLLHGYGVNPQYTRLLNTTHIYINPLANPDGTYRSGNNTVQGARRYNANNVDLNRNFPNPFGSSQSNLQQENVAMINYFSAHHFRLSANLHGGSEVMNYPWDCFTSAQRPHPKSAWWQEVCKRFVDTSRVYSSNHFNDVNSEGYIAGGDWYVITGGRQDYVNYYHNCLELTMEISTVKTLSSDNLPVYWGFLQHSLVNYIDMIHHLNLVSVEIQDTTMGTVAGGGLFGEGDTVTLLATAKCGYRFTHWSNGVLDNPLQVVVAGDTDWVAYFEEAPQYMLTIQSDDTLMGAVEGGGEYYEGCVAILTPQAREGYAFDHWMDGDTANPRLVTVTSDTLFTAYFVIDTVPHSGIRVVEGAPRIYVRDGRIVVEADGQQVTVYDVMGRRVADAVLRRGVYFVRVGEYPIRKVVVL